jgi:hypothetical protein
MADAPTPKTREPGSRSLIDRAFASTGAAFVLLFAGGLTFADLVAATTFPTPTQPRRGNRHNSPVWHHPDR